MFHDLYLSLADEKRIDLYQRSPTSGAMTTLSQTPTKPMPRAFNICPGGGYLCAAGLDSGKLASYRILDNNALEAVGRFEMGEGPMWVLPIAL